MPLRPRRARVRENYAEYVREETAEARAYYADRLRRIGALHRVYLIAQSFEHDARVRVSVVEGRGIYLALVILFQPFIFAVFSAAFKTVNIYYHLSALLPANYLWLR